MTATLTTLVSFKGANGAGPGGPIADGNGDLFGTTTGGGANGDGTVFEIVKTAGGYASTPTTLVSFNDADGGEPEGSLIADADGDLFGTTPEGGANDDGTVFEIAKTAVGYASTPTTLVALSDDAFSEAGLIADANGDLFGTTTGIDPTTFSTLTDGTVFEIVKTASGYASTPTTLVSFNGTNGETPFGSLIADSNGDLFGTTDGGGANDFGTVFEIAKTAGGYATAPTTLVSFSDDDGVSPKGSLIADADGDLFGTTVGDGFSVAGTVFEIVKTPTGYASTPTTLVSFNNDDGSPNGSLIADANGDLFGTTINGGANDVGTVFEIAKSVSATGYASTPTILISFNGTNGVSPDGSLIADANGDLFGATGGDGANDKGTVFEITDSGFGSAPPPPPPPTVTADILWQNTDGQASIWDMHNSTLVGGGPVSPNPGPSWSEIGTGDFNHDGHSDILWQNVSTGQASVWEMNGNTLIGGGAVTPNPGPGWRAVGMGDFTDDGFSDDILWQNVSTGQASIWEMSGNTLMGGGAVSPNPGPAWKAIGTGDFTGDGHPDDILWQNTSTGQVSVWEMSGNTLIGGGAVSPNPGPAWQAIGTGDFNGDHHSDILFQNTSTGQVSVWEMSGNTLVGGGPISANPGPAWHAIGTDGGGSDILLQNTSTGQASIWDMDGNTIIGGGAVSADPGPSWHAIGLT